MLDRLSKTKLILPIVFVLTVGLTVIAGYLIEKLANSAAITLSIDPSYPRLSEKLQQDLNSAHAPEMPFNLASAKNPFGYLPTWETQNSKDSSKENSKDSKMISSPAITPVTTPVVTPVSLAKADSNPVVNPTPTTVNQPDSRQLLLERQKQIKQGQQVKDLSSIYSIDEVRPIGIIGSGNKNKVWLYAPNTKQRFTVHQGASFRDGILEQIRDTGLLFRRSDGTIVQAQWVKNKELQDTYTPVLRAERPVLTSKNLRRKLKK